jgi:hypothetical protein
MQREPAVFAELRRTDHQRARGQVHVGVVERDRLADAHAADRQQPEHTAVGRTAQRPAERAGRRDQGVDVGLRVQVWVAPPAAVGQQIDRWNLDRRVDGVQVAGEPADDAQPLCVAHRLCLAWFGRPRDRRRGSDRAYPGVAEEGDEVCEQPVMAA